MFFNRLTVFTKRIFANRLYLAMLVCLIILSVIYALLPANVKTTDIKVALYIEDSLPYNAVYDTASSSGDAFSTDTYGDELYLLLADSGSVYTYSLSASLEELRENVESGRFECGFYIPSGFFEGYINGLSDTPKIVRYETASTTLGNAITESVFSQIFKLCAADILYLAYNNTASNDALFQHLEAYINGDKIFRIEEHSADRILDNTVSAPVNIPVRELSVLLIILSGLLGLLMYVSDAERNIYIALSGFQKFTIRLTTLLSSVMPMLLVSLVCCLVTYKNRSVLPLLLSAAGVIVFAVFPGVLFKKSSSLARLLPVIMLILIPIAAFLL
jgi:hypothetical protein